MKFLFGKITPHGIERGMFGGVGPFFTGVLSLLWVPFRFLGYVMVLAGRIAAGWFGKRQFRYLLYGVPSIVAFVVFGIFLIRGVMYGGSYRADQYANAAAKAVKAGQWKEAQLFYQRAIDMGRNERSTRFELAKAAQQNGDLPVKASVLEDLAPVENAVFAPAHLWVALTLLSDEVSVSELQAARTHLEHALSLEPQNVPANRLLGEIFFQSGRPELALRHLGRVPNRGPDHELMTAKALSMTGRNEEASAHAERAIQAFRLRLAANELDEDARIALADGLFFQEDFSAAANTLAEGIRLNSESASLRTGLAKVYVAWSDSLAPLGDAADARRFELLGKALLANPDEFQVYDRLTVHLSTKEGEVSEAGIDMLLENIATGKAVAMSHLILGTIADVGTSASRVHLERAHELNPGTPVIINNLAWTIAHAENPDLETALHLMDDVIAKVGPTPDLRFLDTRGVIHAKLGNWQAAVQDLERGLPQHRNSYRTHLALARAYRELGAGKLAERHSEIATSLSPADEGS